MGIAKITNIPTQWVPVNKDNGEGVQPAQKISVPASAAKLADLIDLSPNTELVLVDFYGSCRLRFDGIDVSADTGHVFSVNDHPAFSAQLLPYISIISNTGSATEAFASQFSGVA